jgi:hypothetical protein
MNDEKEYSISTLLNAINGGIGDMMFDATDYTVKVNNGNHWSTVTNSVTQPMTTHALEIPQGTVKIGNLVMEVDQFETCMRHLLELTKQSKPEEFI